VPSLSRATRLMHAAATPVGLDDITAAVRRLLDDPANRVVIVVLFGAPGRGKTTLATHLGSAQDRFTELNSSSERRGHELREALSRFVSDGNQAGVKFRHRHEGSAAEPRMAKVSGAHSSSRFCEAVLRSSAGLPAHPPCCALLLDEADGLGAIGQATVASFVDDLEQDGCWGPARSGSGSGSGLPRWRALIMLTCNTLGLLHDSILSRAHVLAEVPRPTPELLVQAARQWLREEQGSAAEPTTAAAASAVDGKLSEIAAMADGDFRAMRQLMTLEMCGARGSLAASITPTLRGLLRVLQGADDYNMVAWQRAWDEGRRADDIQHWVTMALYLPTLSPERRLALLQFRRSLEAMQRLDGPHSLLQVIGAFARDVLKVNARR
jgi:hypothetical protein